jgi:hypothetical protein
MSDPGSSQLSRPSAPERCRVEQDRHLRRQGTTPVEARWHRPGSIETVRDRGEWHGGGLAGEDDLAHSGAVWRQPPPWRVRPVLVPHCLLGKPPSPARQANLARHVRERRASPGQLRQSRQRGRLVWATLATSGDASSGAPPGAPGDPTRSEHGYLPFLQAMVAVMAWVSPPPSPWHATAWPPRPPSARSRPDPAD